jgi:hypothetical protein
MKLSFSVTCIALVVFLCINPVKADPKCISQDEHCEAVEYGIIGCCVGLKCQDERCQPFDAFFKCKQLIIK